MITHKLLGGEKARFTHYRYPTIQIASVFIELTNRCIKKKWFYVNLGDNKTVSPGTASK